MRAPAFWWGEPGVAAALLSPFAAIYGSIATRRLTQPGVRVGIPVICVGNPTVGGSGKTPAAIAIAKMLIAAGEKPYFLTRGYGGHLAGPVMVEPAHTAVQVGDEPLLLARVAPTIVAANRVAGAQLAKERGASVIVMDDGFQNPSLAKDFSLLVIDTARGVGNAHVLPAGPLRAPMEPQLDRASAMLIVTSPTDTPRIAQGTPRPKRPLPGIIGTLEPDAEAIAALRGKRVLAFAGIGNPEKFFATVAAAGIDAPVRRTFGDHHRFSAKEATALLREAESNGFVPLTTEKDFVRIKGDAALVRLADTTRVLPVTLVMAEPNPLQNLVIDSLRRGR